ncbi:MAG: hypothetical protein ACP5D2_02330 [Candidatus Nanoarchaeia archaeon]
MAISEKLIDEIGKKIEHVQANPDYYLKRDNRLRADLRAICDIYSFWIENPSLRRQILRTSDIGKKE